MNEEDLLKQLQEYFQKYNPVQRQYDPNQQKVWSDTQPSYEGLRNIGAYIDTQQKQNAPSNLWDQTDMTLQRLLQMQQKKYKM